jgi:hypothetical protein
MSKRYAAFIFYSTVSDHIHARDLNAKTGLSPMAIAKWEEFLAATTCLLRRMEMAGLYCG